MDPQLTGVTGLEGYGEPMPQQQEVDEFLRKKRKAREHKACYPCRQRKVKCDLSRPCQTCRDRDHPELCSYHPPNKRQNVEGHPPAALMGDGHAGPYPPGPSGPGYVAVGTSQLDMMFRQLHSLENSIAELRREVRRNAGDHTGMHESDGTESSNGQRAQTHTDLHGLHTKNESGEIVHLGGGSVPAMLYALSQGQTPGAQEQQQLQEFLGKSVLPMFGLDNESATYPFVDLWGLPHGSLQRARELARALPSDNQLMSLFASYRDLGHIIYPGIADVKQLETDLTGFLLSRASYHSVDDGVTESTIYGKSFYWLGMLFAVLASGAQCSALTRKERELTSQVYVCCGFECLRFTNFLSQPHAESIQALLIIGNVMTNNMNAGTAWSLLGLTIRLAQGLGLHQACPPHITHDVVLPRSRIWWAVVWQDSLLSITYDRNASLDVNTMPMPQNFGPVSSYHASMYRICKVGLDIIRDRAKSASSREYVARINQHRDEIASIMRDSMEHLRDSRQCKSSQETLEHWALYLHTSYSMSELCRPAISPRMPDPVKAFKSVCVENLINTVEAFLGLNNITFFARQSWAAVHRALSSALLLGILGEHRTNDRARKLIARFISLMGDITSTVDPSEISAPVQRGVAALRKLNIEEIRSGSFADAATLASPADGGGTISGGDGNLKIDHSQIFTPANSDTAGTGDEEHSPYSVLNSILWGNNNGALSSTGENQAM
ncbi:Putative zn(2)-C6 fungal-type DNA-binding domain, flavin prenyltransferase UbiX [Septoria linicola]|uniref:Zn(2)-C6 fungal-type DNA-binding domain, flavin prenyltransferase UbiX n=1 Tax=Septoria linicola TaxID=215465 RepID=A0A9Q9B2P7_9PEZI|nr:putative zn(2)-C6 fungal-type DNA-binding domain, flavin prenyltransferase UbiX [Septoria linicola]USW56458.1 Putative zn(2)-C6 fungal-type DNA-binding domain, flavin prenyltransferase UbiX [Septoria linicola]